jgi:hypothetical protein
MDMKTQRIVLHESVSERDVDAAAWNNDWSLVRAIKASESAPHEVIWKDNIEDVTIHYVEDFYIDIAYFVLNGDRLDSVVEDIQKALPNSQHQDDFLKVLGDSQEVPEHLVPALYGLGLTAPESFDPKIFSIFQQFLSHPRPELRAAVLTAIGYVGWPEFKALLEPVQQSDPDPEVRKDAEVMLAGFEQYLPGMAIAS